MAAPEVVAPVIPVVTPATPEVVACVTPEVVASVTPEVVATAHVIPEATIIPENSAIPEQHGNRQEHEAPPNSPPGVESLEEDMCRKFKKQTCGCRKVSGKHHCSDLFPVDHYLELQAQSSFLTRDELDLVLMGSIMCTAFRDDCIRDGRRKPVKRRKLTTMMYMHEGHKVCKKTFCFLYSIGKDRLRAVKENYLANGLVTRTHGNKKHLPHNAISPETINNIVMFLQNYAEENAILLPGRIPSHKRDDIKLLPSSCSKRASCKTRINYKMLHCLHLPLNPQMPVNWLSTIRPTEKLFIYYYSPLSSPSNDVIIEISLPSPTPKKSL